MSIRMENIPTWERVLVSLWWLLCIAFLIWVGFWDYKYYSTLPENGQHFTGAVTWDQIDQIFIFLIHDMSMPLLFFGGIYSIVSFFISALTKERDK